MRKYYPIFTIISLLFLVACDSEPEGYEVIYHYVSGNALSPYYEDSYGRSIVFKGHAKHYLRTKTIQTTLRTKIKPEYKCPNKNTCFEYEYHGQSLNDWTECLRCEYTFHVHIKQKLIYKK